MATTFTGSQVNLAGIIPLGRSVPPHRVTSVPSPGFQGHLTGAADTLPSSPVGSILPPRESSIPFAASLAYRVREEQPRTGETTTSASRDARLSATSASFRRLSGSVPSARETYLHRRCLFRGAASWLTVTSTAHGTRWPNDFPALRRHAHPRCDRAPSTSLELIKTKSSPHLVTHTCNPTIWDVRKAGRSEVQSQLQLLTEFKDALKYM